MSPRVSVDSTSPCEETRTRFLSLSALEEITSEERGSTSAGLELVFNPRSCSHFLAWGLPQRWGSATLSVGLVVTNDIQLKAVRSAWDHEGMDLLGTGVIQLSSASLTKLANHLCASKVSEATMFMEEINLSYYYRDTT